MIDIFKVFQAIFNKKKSPEIAAEADAIVQRWQKFVYKPEIDFAAEMTPTGADDLAVALTRKALDLIHTYLVKDTPGANMGEKFFNAIQAVKDDPIKAPLLFHNAASLAIHALSNETIPVPDAFLLAETKYRTDFQPKKLTDDFLESLQFDRTDLNADAQVDFWKKDKLLIMVAGDMFYYLKDNEPITIETEEDLKALL